MTKAKKTNSGNVESVEEQIDGLFALPLPDFTLARNSLAGSLKRDGNSEDAERVKSLAKPTVSAWAANQLYWKHRRDFDLLIAAGQEFRQAQAAQLAGKLKDTRKPAEARQQAINELLRIAAGLLRDGGHNPSPDTIRRVSTTLEAISSYSSLPEGSSLGRLSEDIEAPGFDALSALFSGHAPRPQKTVDSGKNRNEKVAAKSAALREAQQTLNAAETRERSLQLELRQATEAVEEAERRKQEAEERFQNAKRAALEAVEAVETAQRAVARATQELDQL